MHLKVLLGGIALALAVTGADPVHAQTNVLFVFDASGSMKRDAGSGETRMVVAKRAIGETLRSMPPSARLGLMVYGHRRGKDCSDIELVSPIASEDAGALARYVSALDARGETPIAESLARAGKSFAAFKGQSNRIVLVTDGIEECQGDPCAVAASLAVVGFQSLEDGAFGWTDGVLALDGHQDCRPDPAFPSSPGAGPGFSGLRLVAGMERPSAHHRIHWPSDLIARYIASGARSRSPGL